MASSQIGITSTSSPFGHVLRDHNPRDQWNKRDSNATSLQNLKDFVDSISGQPNKKSQNDVHNKNANTNGGRTGHADLWVHIPTYKTNENNNDVPQSNKCDDHMAKEKAFKFSPVSSVSPGQIKVSKPNNNGGVSSLVRRWKDFEAEAKNSASNSPSSSSRTISIDSILIRNSSFHSHSNNDNESLVDMRSETRSMSEETFGDSESDASEKERTRVVDIIRKLTSTGGVHEENSNDQESYSPLRTSLDLEQQRSCVSPGAGSQRFRRRQESEDLWLKQQRENRHLELQGIIERNAVSKFSQKGRLQAMLRLQVLRHGAMDAKDTRVSNSTSLEVNRLPESSIKQLRERFKIVSQDSAPRWNSPRKTVEDLSQVEKSTSVQESKDTKQHEVAVQKSVPERDAENTETKESVLKSAIVDGEATRNDKNKNEEQKNILNEACLNSEFLHERTNEEKTSCSLRLSADTSVSPSADKEACSTEGDEKRVQQRGIGHESMDLQENQQPNETIHDMRIESVNTQQDWDKECSSMQYVSESEHGWVSDVSHIQVGWEESHSDYGQQSDSMQDWISDISRPRSEWEDLRQERYQEMLDPLRQKEDISHLLESKSVSSFLSSALRERIDRLMICRTQQQLSGTGSLTDEQVVEVEEPEYKVEVEHEVVGDVIQEVEGDDAGYDQDDEYESEVKQQYEESVECKDQTSHSPKFTSRNRNHDPETSDCFDLVESSPLQQDSSQNSYSQESRTCSSMTNKCSIEIQLIYELRGQMEKLHQEMSEIRKSIKGCMNKQLKLQLSVGHDVTTTLSHSGTQNRGRHSTQQKGLINKSMCCICSDVQVDSLLYRCGHMCTCFKCAHELQRGNGRCPVCQAPIIDVVRAQADF